MAEQQNGGMRPSQAMVTEATRLLEARINGGVALSDKDLRSVAISAVKTADASNSGLSGNPRVAPSPHAGGNNNNSSNTASAHSRVQRGALSSDVFNTNPANREGNPNSSAAPTSPKVHHLPPMGGAGGGGLNTSSYGIPTPSTTSRAGDASSLIVNTTKRQRKILADREWARAAEEDRINSRVMAVKEREDQARAMAEQRAKLDEQRGELEARREEERRMREAQKQQMTDHIALHKQLTLKEQQEARDKAIAEKKVREQQHREASEARERGRQQDYDDQMRRLAIINEQQRAQREADISAKVRKQQEWRSVMQQNEERTRDKALRKEHERAEDREYQRKYKENQDRLEAERAALYARKDAKQRQHLALADRVAEQFNAKEQSHLDKIHTEYEAQMRNDQEDEANRKRINKQKMQECLNFQQQQIAEKRRQEEERKADERRQAEEVRQQILENQRQEQAKKMMQHQEQLRMRQFLNTQLQMAHFKETQEPETSIMRPPHAAVNMFNTASIRSGSRLSNANGSK